MFTKKKKRTSWTLRREKPHAGSSKGELRGGGGETDDNAEAKDLDDRAGKD